MKEEKSVITFKGDRDAWIDFVSKVKKQRKKVWEVLEPLIKEYTKK